MSSKSVSRFFPGIAGKMCCSLVFVFTVEELYVQMFATIVKLLCLVLKSNVAHVVFGRYMSKFKLYKIIR